VAKAHGAAKTGNNLGRSWRASWVSGEGRVNRAGSYDESLDESYRGGATYERYLWQVHVRRGDPGVECLCGMKPRDGGVVKARSVGYSL
jgi:hypothetical protein